MVARARRAAQRRPSGPTVLSGAHYFIDVLATGVVFLASLGAFRLFGPRLLPAGE